MRVIIRFSLNRDRNSKLRNSLKAILEEHGIMWTGKTTASYEGFVAEKKVRRALSKFWGAIAQNQTQAKMDHFWMYTDRQAKPLLADPLE